MVLISNNIVQAAECIHTSERLVVVKVGDVLFMDVYLPCVGTQNRFDICSDILIEICFWRQKFPFCGCVIGGDFNTDLDIQCTMSNIIRKFLVDNQFSRCYGINCLPYTFVNESRNFFSNIDHIVFNNVHVENFEVLEPCVNFSDHLPITVYCSVCLDVVRNDLTKNVSDNDSILHLRWDHADLALYYNATRDYLQPILTELINLDCLEASHNYISPQYIYLIYERVVTILNDCANLYVPRRKNSFYKFWWSQELDCLKSKAIESNKVWQAVGRPRSGPVYTKRNSDKRAYRVAIRKAQSDTDEKYSNHLHELLLSKRGNDFWRSWNAKFGKSAPTQMQVNGQTDPISIVNIFVDHFKVVCTDRKTKDSLKLLETYNTIRPNYVGSPFIDDYLFDVELVEKIIGDMKRGKAAGLDGLTVEHLIHCHPVLLCILSRLFNLFIYYSHVPPAFGQSYTVPLLKSSSNSYSKNLTANDFRGISVSPVLSKVFEHCVLTKFESFFISSCNQFGFKKNVSCSHAIYTVKNIVNYFVSHGSTVNLCAVDISKAFDYMNHFGLFIKLMDRHLPLNLLRLLEDWFSKCFTCIKWNSVFSEFFQLTCGVRQGGVLSPYLFAVYINDIVSLVENKRIGCCYRSACVSIIMYADDILLLAPSLVALQELLHVCENSLRELDLSINITKSVCTRIGPRCYIECSDITSIDGKILQWVDTVRYLGVYIVRARQFKCSFNNAKASFYRAFNAVFGRLGRSANEDIIIHLVNIKCLPCLLYGLDACPLNKSDINSLEYTINRVHMKIFQTTSIEFVKECRRYFGICELNDIIIRRKLKFLNKFSASECFVCQLFAECARSEYISLCNYESM